MEKLKKMLKELCDLDDMIDALFQDDDAPLDETARARHTKLQAERVALCGRIDREKEKRARQDERERLQGDLDTQARILAAGQSGQNRRTGRDEPTSTAAPAAATVPAQVIDPAEHRRRGFRTPREFLMSVMDAGEGRSLDRRLVPLDQRRVPQQATAGSDEARGNFDPYGGFLLPEDFSPDFLQLTPEADPMASYIRRIPMGRPIVRIPARTDKNHTTSVSGGLTVTRRPETVAGSSSQMTMEQVSMEAHSLFGLSYATEELLIDSPQSFIAIIETGFNEQFTYQLISERISGTGVGEFEGILNSPALITVAAVAGQAAKTVVKENIDQMRSQCWGYQNAIWIANHDVGPQLSALNQAVGTAGTGMIWMPTYREDYPDMLLGRPLIFSEYAETLGTAGDLILFNGQEYLEGTYQPLQTMESIHVRFINHERAFKFWLRNDGRGWWKSALTPKNSSSLLSPFVVLHGR